MSPASHLGHSVTPLPPLCLIGATIAFGIYTVKKGSRISRLQPGCHYSDYTKLSLGGNNDVITELFLPRGSLVSDIPAGDGKLVNLFLRCSEKFPKFCISGMLYVRTY